MVKGAFIQLRIVAIQRFRDDQTENGIAEKLKALVIVLINSAARVRQGELEERGVCETIPRLFFKAV